MRLGRELLRAEGLEVEIVREGAGSRLLCTVWFGKPGPHGIPGTAAGYHICLDALGESLDTGSGGVPERDLIIALENRYTEIIG